MVFRCRWLTYQSLQAKEIWYGARRGGNLSILYSWFVDARRSRLRGFVGFGVSAQGAVTLSTLLGFLSFVVGFIRHVCGVEGLYGVYTALYFPMEDRST